MNFQIMSQFLTKNLMKLLTHSLIYYLLTIFLIVITFVSVVSSFSLSGSPLYDPNSKEIRILSDTNFSRHVFEDESNAGRIQLIQFYNSWCGHCISFAPTFKELAHKSRHWNKLMIISVVDCAQDINTKLCRNMDINVYPTLKLFWFSPKEDQKGFELSVQKRTVEGIQESIITWINDNWSKGVPRSWPDLMPVSAVSKDKFMKFLPIEKGIPIVLVVENQKSFLGREIMLDLSAYQSSVTVFRMLDSSKALINELMPHPLDTFKLPFMLTIDNKDYNFKLLQTNVYQADRLRDSYTNIIRSEFIKSEDSQESDLIEHNFQQISPIRLPEDSSVGKDSNVIDSPLGIEQHIHMSDLNNALRYSLFQEIALKKKLNSTQLNALKNYLSVLELHFPFQTDKMRSFVKFLNEWLSKKKAGVDVEIDDIMTTMKIYEDYYHFPEMKPWKECAGSESKYRGYPCSMWTLFHTLTVSEYKNTSKSKKWSTLHSVLYAMRDYIKNFFGCSYCAEHFQKMAADLESELTYPNRSVLWLWRAHNRVNKRLKGDSSEDPKHPKQPYPPRNQCPECYESNDNSDEPIFNEKNVFQFILRHYSSDNLIKDESELKDDEQNSDKLVIKRPHISEQKPNLSSGKSSVESSALNDINTSIKTKWNYNLLNNVDYSLILFLYFSSAAIIITLCVYLKIRVRKRGQKYGSLKSSLSYA